MATEVKLEKMIKFLEEALAVCVTFLRKSKNPTASILFVIDNAQLMDSSSWALIERILEVQRGVFFAISISKLSNDSGVHHEGENEDGSVSMHSGGGS
jgi:hypothetical protein